MKPRVGAWSPRPRPRSLLRCFGLAPPKAFLPHLLPTETPRDLSSVKPVAGKRAHPVCRNCGKAFPDETELFNHLSLVCAVVFQCDFCTFNFDRIENLANHVRTFHSDPDKADPEPEPDVETPRAAEIFRQIPALAKFTFRDPGDD